MKVLERIAKILGSCSKNLYIIACNGSLIVDLLKLLSGPLLNNYFIPLPCRRACLGEAWGVHRESARSLDLSRSEHQPVTPLSPEGTGFAARVPHAATASWFPPRSIFWRKGWRKDAEVAVVSGSISGMVR